VDYFDYSSDLDDVEEFLERSQENEGRRLEEELERIDNQLEERDRIHQEVLDELESKPDWYLDRLKTMYRRCQGKSGERGKLKSQIRDFYIEIGREKQRNWRDRQELEQDRKEVIRELNELEDSIPDLI